MPRTGQGYKREAFQQTADCLFCIAEYHGKNDTTTLCNLSIIFTDCIDGSRPLEVLHVLP